MTHRRAIILLFFLGCIGFSAAILLSIKRPLGEWDAWAIWNAKARVIIEGGDIWSTLHPDYPLLLPMLIALLWWMIGTQTPVAPAAVSIAFGVATVAMLVRAVRRHVSATTGIISGCVLLTSPFFITQSAAQYADLPLAFLILASLASLDAPILAGALAGLASSVKNEGLLFLVALTIALSAVKPKVLPRFLMGAAPLLIVLLFFKVFLSPPNDLLGALSPSVFFARVSDPSRWGQVLGTLSVELINVILWGAGTLPILIIYLLAVKRQPGDKPKTLIQVVSITLVIMLSGLITIYLITPMDLKWHMGTSVDRLILQLFPTILFLFFLLAGKREPDSKNLPQLVDQSREGSKR